MSIQKLLPIVACGCFAVAAAGMARAQNAPPTEVDRMRAAAVASLAREAPAAVTNNASLPWQQPIPKAFRRSLRPPLVAEYKFTPHLSPAETGTKQRFTPVTEQLAIGLSGDPPRPSYLQLAAGPRSFAPALSSQEHLLLPPLSRNSEAKVNLTSDAATIQLKPYTAAVVHASRASAPARSEAIPDPFVAAQEVRLRVVPADNAPPPLHFELPERPLLPVMEVKK